MTNLETIVATMADTLRAAPNQAVAMELARELVAFEQWREDVDADHLCSTYDLALGWAGDMWEHETACIFAKLAQERAEHRDAAEERAAKRVPRFYGR